MSIFDQIGEQYWAAAGKALGYKDIGWFSETTTLPTHQVETSTSTRAGMGARKAKEGGQ